MATKRRSTRKVRGRTQKKRSMKRNTKSNRGRKNRNLKRGGTNKKHSLKRNRKQRGGYDGSPEEQEAEYDEMEKLREQNPTLAEQLEAKKDKEWREWWKKEQERMAAKEEARAEAALDKLNFTCDGKLKPKNN